MGFAPSWTELFTKHSLVNGLSSEFNPVPEGYELKFIHSSVSNFKRMELTGDLGSRFAFPSLVQAIAHQVTHHHFALSNSTLREDSVVIHLWVKSAWLSTNSHSAKNGYAHSVSISSLPTDQ
eukprot:4037382-Amphidinium_carterae.1